MLADRLRPYSTALAAHFADVAVPAPLLGTEPPPRTGADALGPVGESARVLMLAGPYAICCAPSVHALARRLGAPVANTWGAKGIYPWDDPHHMGTCGLQRDDFALLGFDTADVLVTVGIDPDESPDDRLGADAVVHLDADAAALDAAAAATPPRPLPDASANELYRRIAAIAQPGYVDDSVPRHPARAVMDLKRSLGPATRVCGQPGAAGLWLARTFPTDRMGSVVVPARDRPGVAAAVGLVSAAEGADTVCVVANDVDDATAEALAVAGDHSWPLRLEVWTDVDWARTDDLVAAAGPVVAWTT